MGNLRQSNAAREAAAFPEFIEMIGLEHRLEILVAVISVRRSVSELAVDLGLDQSTVSEALGCMADGGVLVFVQEGHRRCYEPSPNLSVRAIDAGLELVMRCGDGSVSEFRLSEQTLANLRRHDRRAAHSVQVTPAAVLPPPARARTDPRPASAHG